MKIKRKFNKEKGWFEYEPLLVMMKCTDCYYEAECFTWQIVEKEYHVSGRIFCPHCKGKLIPVEKLEIIN